MKLSFQPVWLFEYYLLTLTTRSGKMTKKGSISGFPKSCELQIE
jgi:hypothetical protein